MKHLTIRSIAIIVCASAASTAVAQDHSTHAAMPSRPSAAPQSPPTSHADMAMPSEKTAEEASVEAPPSPDAASKSEDPHAHHMQMTPATASGTQSEARHVPPDPPQHAMRDMSEQEMIELMEMDDTSAFSMLRANSFEWRTADQQDSLSWDVEAWYGTDFNKLWLKTEGDRTNDETDARIEVLWDRPIARWWSVQAGARHDVGEGPARTWAAFGVEGLAPYFFEVEATAYVGEQGRTALRFSADLDLLLTQRLILQPELELDVFGKSDPQNLIGSGLSDTELALRLRYEFRREFAPYVGVAWTQRYGNTADLARAASFDVSEVQWLAGVRWWF